MPKTILLIENDDELINVYTIALTKIDHFKVEVIRYGHEALKWIKKSKSRQSQKAGFNSA